MTIGFVSTRGGGGGPVSLGSALAAGLAPDGGLYVPERVPRFDSGDFDGAAEPAAVASVLLAPYFAGSGLESELGAIARETFSFGLPLRPAGAGHPAILELFHGPTAAFKDVGARFLAACLQRLPPPAGETRPLLILVATSGDTGGAVAAAFHGRSGFEVAVLFPLGRVSQRQQHQLTCWGGNVAAFGVNGSFDDCQRLVKAAFVDPGLAARYRLSSANSINIGRLLPQSVYYACASLAHFRATGRPLSLVVPTGNLGNGLAAVLARAMGLPIGRIVFATNANRTLPDFLASGRFEPRDSIATLASAMDVGNPSNLERLRGLFGDAAALRGQVTAAAVDDATIERTIAAAYRRDGLIVCPHTATALHVWETLPASERDDGDWAIVATAHPAKFEAIVEPLIGTGVELPPALAQLLSRPAAMHELAPELAALARGLKERR